MTDRKTVEITRYDVVTPDHCNIDEYGNLIIVTTNNQEIKVNKKHEGNNPILDVRLGLKRKYSRAME